MDYSGIWHTQDPTVSNSQDGFQQFFDTHLDCLNPEFEGYTRNLSQGSVTYSHSESMEGSTKNEQKSESYGHNAQESSLSNEAMSNLASYSEILLRTREQQTLEIPLELSARIEYLQRQQQPHKEYEMHDQQHKTYAKTRAIPPTPTSVEMNCVNPHFYNQAVDSQQHTNFERYPSQLTEQEMAFTPLVSPAVTPIEYQPNPSEYTFQGAYFSPLSSPAIQAQNENQSSHDQRYSILANFPMDLDIDLNTVSGGSTNLTRSQNMRTSSTQIRRPARIRKSPTIKPTGRQKGSAQPLLFPNEGSGSPQTKAKASKSNAPGSKTPMVAPESNYLAPENYSNMPPPPLPSPVVSGRYMQNSLQNKNAIIQSHHLQCPATPASLMGISQTIKASHSEDLYLENRQIEDNPPSNISNFTRPQARYNSEPSAISLSATTNSTGTSRLQPLPSSPLSKPSKNSLSSPGLPTENQEISTKSEWKTKIGPRVSKKRTCILASPAILPRISPNIKALLPSGDKVHEDTASLILASKSNYQNILEGNHLPGISYSSELSSHLTSKRTSHKLAEQGRRNRMNSALQMMATLLPRGSSTENGAEKVGSGSSGDGDGQRGFSQSANSKASTVEQAIDYINFLKGQLDVANKKLELIERSNSELDQKLPS
ncbi:HLH transcription factor [Blumeria hordei DH14]|uniref:HLH transcription factor n=1 Tax=Blumeria graminis f. sp. hordei (strain DH14) TaxID=546991 RepID=N1JHX4_BLUG1|nr:HLH transcription factor [Blumeria hordei DH14]